MENTIFTHIEFLQNKFFEKADTTVPPHNHYFHEMTYVLEGKLHTDIDSHHYECGEGSILLVPPNKIHSHSSSSDYRVIYMGFFYNGLYGPLTQIVFKDENGAILNILNQILKEYDRAEPYSEKICAELQKIFIFNILRQQDNNASTNNEDVLKYAVAYLQDHYYEDINMQELAKSLGYSYHHFRHIFKESFDMPPKQFLFNQRIQYAVRFLRDTNQSISDIARNCGFASSTRFISAFKSVFKISPMQYRNSDTVNLDISVFFENNKINLYMNNEIFPLEK